LIQGKEFTDSAIPSIIKRMPEALEAIGIFFDLTNAYDILNHYMLLDKLNSFVVRGNINSCFQ
jgi:hypothetical protein